MWGRDSGPRGQAGSGCDRRYDGGLASFGLIDRGPDRWGLGPWREGVMERCLRPKPLQRQVPHRTRLLPRVIARFRLRNAHPVAIAVIPPVLIRLLLRRLRRCWMLSLCRVRVSLAEGKRGIPLGMRGMPRGGMGRLGRVIVIPPRRAIAEVVAMASRAIAHRWLRMLEMRMMNRRWGKGVPGFLRSGDVRVT